MVAAVLAVEVAPAGDPRARPAATPTARQARGEAGGQARGSHGPPCPTHSADTRAGVLGVGGMCLLHIRASYV